eukprot:CAMPEP_0172899538 /NCGR_PEP_ID=MMETSP1075-20121228/162070_1 /TAXON_ID=2916 /ORGANISM="Ceratium fusus, Strain PA161109" /LENGTH=64 /DNA_ID=CAMNT_0013755545 /DNA_START=1 /DNA_END=191 /DNA_ORIENTATION=-
MGSGASCPASLLEKMERIIKLEDPSEEDIRAFISELPPAICEKVRRVFEDVHHDQYLFDVAGMR